jgi:predicted extracellular nuclease
MIRHALRMTTIATLCGVLASPAVAVTGVRISEWMYNGAEFIELTNFGPSPVDFTGWSFDDDSRTPGAVSLSSFGTVAVGESIIIAESPVAEFRTIWGLAASVKVLGENATNLGRADEINVYDAASALVDRLTYGDNVIAGTIRTLNTSGRPATLGALGANDVAQWVLSEVGDAAGSYMVEGLFVGNPGIAPVPEPETYAMMLAGLAAVGLALRRRRTLPA